MRADVDVEVVLVALVAEQGVRLRQGGGVDVLPEAGQLALLVRQAPGVEVEVEGVVVHDVLLQPLDAAVRGHGLEAFEPGVVAPGPDAGRHDVGEHERVHQLGEDEHLHVGERHRRGLALEVARSRGSLERNDRGSLRWSHLYRPERRRHPPRSALACGRRALARLPALSPPAGAWDVAAAVVSAVSGARVSATGALSAAGSEADSTIAAGSATSSDSAGGASSSPTGSGASSCAASSGASSMAGCSGPICSSRASTLRCMRAGNSNCNSNSEVENVEQPLGFSGFDRDEGLRQRALRLVGVELRHLRPGVERVLEVGGKQGRGQHHFDLLGQAVITGIEVVRQEAAQQSPADGRGRLGAVGEHLGGSVVLGGDAGRDVGAQARAGTAWPARRDSCSRCRCRG